MKNFTIVILSLIALCACSPKGNDEPLRPGNAGTQPEEPAAPAAAIGFSPENATDHTADNADGTIHIILYREADSDTPPCSCSLSLTEGADFATVDRTAAFGKGMSTATAQLLYSPAKMGARSRTAVITIAESGATLALTIKQAATPWTDEGPRLLFDGRTFTRVQASSRRKGGGTEWRIEGDGIERRFTVSEKGDVAPEPAGGVVPAASYGHGDIWPCVLAPSAAGDGVTALNVCDCTGETLSFPHTEYLFPLPAEGSGAAVAEICDGWLLPAVAVDGLLLNPEENTWTAPAIAGADGTVTVFGPYHNSSPLFRANVAPLLSAWVIRTDGTSAVIDDCPAGFANGGVFAFEFRISGKGSADRNGNTTKITIPTPMHNCRPDGSMSAATDCTWGRLKPTVLTIKH